MGADCCLAERQRLDVIECRARVGGRPSRIVCGLEFENVLQADMDTFDLAAHHRLTPAPRPRYQLRLGKPGVRRAQGREHMDTDRRWVERKRTRASRGSAQGGRDGRG